MLAIAGMTADQCWRLGMLHHHAVHLGVTRIWQDSRLLGVVTGREIQHGLFHLAFGRQRRRPGRIDIDMAGGAGAGAAAIGIDAGDAGS